MGTPDGSSGRSSPLANRRCAPRPCGPQIVCPGSGVVPVGSRHCGAARGCPTTVGSQSQVRAGCPGSHGLRSGCGGRSPAPGVCDSDAIGPEAKEALAAIKPLLGDSSDEIRIAAVQALWKIGRDTTGIKRLAAEFQKRVGSTDSSDVAFVGAAMSVLEDLDSGGQDTVPSLIEAAAATPAGDARRGQLINVVRRIDPNGKAAFPKLLELSKAEVADRRVLAFAAASAYGLATEDLIALAKKCLDDPDRGVQTAAATAVCLFSDDPKAAKVFIDCLKNSNGLINWGVVQHLSANRAVLPDSCPGVGRTAAEVARLGCPRRRSRAEQLRVATGNRSRFKPA